MDGAEKKGNMPTSPTMLSGTVKLVTFAPPTVYVMDFKRFSAKP